jgi:hypothetical protein
VPLAVLLTHNDLEATFFAGHSGAVWDKRAVGGGRNWFTHFVAYLPLHFAPDGPAK